LRLLHPGLRQQQLRPLLLHPAARGSLDYRVLLLLVSMASKLRTGRRHEPYMSVHRAAQTVTRCCQVMERLATAPVWVWAQMAPWIATSRGVQMATRLRQTVRWMLLRTVVWEPALALALHQLPKTVTIRWGCRRHSLMWPVSLATVPMQGKVLATLYQLG